MSEQQAQVIITYSNSQCKWNRKVTLSYSMHIRQGLVLEKCMGINRKMHRHVVAQVSNYASSPFTLFPNHKNGEMVSAESGLVLAPTESKILIADPEVINGYAITKTESFKHDLAQIFQWRSVCDTD